MSDFKQQVEEILSFTECEHDGRICSDMTLDKYEERPSCEQCRTDRILAAHNAELDRIAEGMKLYYPEANHCNCETCGGVAKQLKTDQAYIQAQKGS